MTNSATTTVEILRRRALIWASEYYGDDTAEWYADWYAATQPALSHVAAFAQFEAWRANCARNLYGTAS